MEQIITEFTDGTRQIIETVVNQTFGRVIDLIQSVIDEVKGQIDSLTSKISAIFS